MNRREWIQAATASVLAMVGHIAIKKLGMPILEAASEQFGYFFGNTLDGWEIVLGDSNNAGTRPEEVLAVSHFDDYTEVLVNFNQEPIVIHGILYRSILNSDAFWHNQRGSFQFRLPFTPVPDPMAGANGETIEGGLFVWDGENIWSQSVCLDYGIAFQWVVNPWVDPPGILNAWIIPDGAEEPTWVQVGQLPIDTEWHTVTFEVNFQESLTRMWIDEQAFEFGLFGTPKPAGWAVETASRLQTEMISINPGGDDPIFVSHRAEFRNWEWTWTPFESLFMPFIQTNSE